MPGSWSWGTEQRALGAGICSSLLQLNLSLLDLCSYLFSRARNADFFAWYFIRWSAAQMVGSLLGPKEKSGLDLPREVFEPQGWRKTSEQQRCTVTIRSIRNTARMPRKSGEIFFFLDCQDHIILNTSSSLMAILEFTAQALSHFLFQPRLSVGGEELASQVVCPWSLARHGNISGQIAQSTATTRPLSLEDRSGCGEQSSPLFRTETCLFWHWWQTAGAAFTIRTCTDIRLGECTQQAQNQIKLTVLFRRHLLLRGGTWLLCWWDLWKC